MVARAGDRKPQMGVDMTRKPTTRGDCKHGPRPCPWKSCRYHLGVTRLHGRNCECACTETCALDVADRGPHTLEEVGALWGLTRERIRQMEVKALRKLRRRASWHWGWMRELAAPDPEREVMIPSRGWRA